MSIFETHVKDVAQRTDSDPLEIVSRFTTVDSNDVSDNSAEIEAFPGEVIVIDGDDLADADTITVTLIEQAPSSGKVIVNDTGSGNAHTINVSAGGDASVVGSGSVSNGGNSTYLADGTDYYEL